MATYPTPIHSAPEPRPRVNRQVLELPPSGIRVFFDLVAGKPGVVSLGVGEPDFSTPWHICEAGIYSLERGHTSYTSNSGTPQLREELAVYLQRKFNAVYDPAKEFIITVGGSEALDLAFRSLLEPGDEAIVLDPSFVSYAPLAALAGGTPVCVPSSIENQFLPRLEDLEKAVSPKTRAIIVNYPNNPTGAALNQSQAEEIADFVLRHDLTLISDEIYMELSYEGRPATFTSIPEIRDRLILLGGFSKAWAMTGWRLGFAAGPSDFIAAMTKIHQYSIMCAPTTAQEAAVEALRHGDDEVERMRKEYDARRRYIVHHFNRIGLDCLSPKGAFYVFPSIRSTGLSSQQFAERLLEKENVAVVPGPAFGKCGEGHIRCSYAASFEDIQEAIQRIERFINTL
ncbi:MAG: aminotransferase class I/II-fold pyridoxal phosphate-dependent enzyme [Candidatus Omnitrophota bacterium]